MTRVLSRPRLGTLSAEATFEPVVRAIVNRALGLTAFVQGEVRALDAESLWSELHGLMAYAQRGDGYRPRAEQTLLRLCDALYRRAGDRTRPNDALGFVLAEARLDEPLGVVLLAAVGRVQLAELRDLPAPCLAVLAQVSVDHLRLLTRRGELQALRDSARTGLRYPPHVARDLLSKQRLPGIEPLLGVNTRVRVLGHDARLLRIHPPPRVPPPRAGQLGVVARDPGPAAREAQVRFDDGAAERIGLQWLRAAPHDEASPLT